MHIASTFSFLNFFLTVRQLVYSFTAHVHTSLSHLKNSHRFISIERKCVCISHCVCVRFQPISFSCTLTPITPFLFIASLSLQTRSWVSASLLFRLVVWICVCACVCVEVYVCAYKCYPYSPHVSTLWCPCRACCSPICRSLLLVMVCVFLSDIPYLLLVHAFAYSWCFVQEVLVSHFVCGRRMRENVWRRLTASSVSCSVRVFSPLPTCLPICLAL